MPIADVSLALVRADRLVGRFDRLLDAAATSHLVADPPIAQLHADAADIAGALGDALPAGLRNRISAPQPTTSPANLVELRATAAQLLSIADAVRGAGGVAAVRSGGGLGAMPEAIQAAARVRLDDAVANLGRATASLDAAAAATTPAERAGHVAAAALRMQVASAVAADVEVGTSATRWQAGVDDAVHAATSFLGTAAQRGLTDTDATVQQLRRGVVDATRDLAHRRFDPGAAAPRLDLGPATRTLGMRRRGGLAARVAEQVARPLQLDGPLRRRAAAGSGAASGDARAASVDVTIEPAAAAQAIATLHDNATGLAEPLRRLDALTKDSFWSADGAARRTEAAAVLGDIRARLRRSLDPGALGALPEAVADPLQELRSSLATIQIADDVAAPGSGGYPKLVALAERLDATIATLTPERLVGARSDAALSPNAARLDALFARAGSIATVVGTSRADVSSVARQLDEVVTALDDQLARAHRLPATRDREAADTRRLRGLVATGVATLRTMRDDPKLDPVMHAAITRLVDGPEVAAVVGRGTARTPDLRGRGLHDGLQHLATLADELPTGPGSGVERLAEARAAADPLLAGGPVDRADVPPRLRAAAALLSATGTADREIPRATNGVDFGLGAGTQGELRSRAAVDAAAIVRQVVTSTPPLPGSLRTSTRALARETAELARTGGLRADLTFKQAGQQLTGLARTIEDLPPAATTTPATIAASRAGIADALHTIVDMRATSTDYEQIATALPRWQQLVGGLDATLSGLPAELPTAFRDPVLRRVDEFADQVAAARRSLAYDRTRLDEALFPRQALLGAIEGDLRMLDDVLAELPVDPPTI